MTITSDTVSGIAGQLEEVAIVMDSNSDQVAIAKRDIPQGTCLKFKNDLIKTRGSVKRGHSFAVKDINPGDYVRQYGYPFGQSRGILKGEAITISNINNVLPQVSLKEFKAPGKTVYREQYLKRTFSGYIRKNGRVGTRNYYLVVPNSMCVSETALQAASCLDRDKEVFRQYPGIDGVVAVPHTEGCGCASNFQIDRFLRIIKGYIEHPNVGGCLIMDLGCEQTNYEKVHKYLNSAADGIKPVDWVTVQKSGGTMQSIKKAVSIITDRLPAVSQVRREDCHLENLIAGTECGASDSFSGITANPVIGNAIDKLIYGGGTAILSEIPEVLGTFEMLFTRFRTMEVADKFKAALDWYTNIAEKLGLTLNDNLVSKNIEGGLINNFIKSLGAVLKGGSSAIEDVIEYGGPLRNKGLNIMQGPGGDLESVTGIVASGANVICFSTGYGATAGNAICPVIKISSNSATFEKMPEDIDFNAGEILTEQAGIDTFGDKLLDKMIAVASGEQTWSEKWKQRQFQVWTAGKLSL